MNSHAGTTGLSTILVALALAGAPALAQTGGEEAQEQAGQAAQAKQAEQAVIPEQAEQQRLTDDLIGRSVYSRAAGGEDLEEIGTIESLLLNENNRLTGVIVSIGGFLGFGAKSIAIDWEALEIEEFGPSEFVATIDISREALEEAPAFKTLAEKEQERAMEQQRQQQGTGLGTGGTGTTGATGTGGATGGAGTGAGTGTE